MRIKFGSNRIIKKAVAYWKHDDGAVHITRVLVTDTFSSRTTLLLFSFYLEINVSLVEGDLSESLR